MNNLIKRIFSIVLALTCIITASVHTSAQSAVNAVGVTVPSTVGYSGENVDISITLTSLSECSGYQIFFTLPEVLTLTGIKQDGKEMVDISESSSSSLYYSTYKSNGKTVLRLADSIDRTDSIIFKVNVAVASDAIGEYSFDIKSSFFDYSEEALQSDTSLGTLIIEHKASEEWKCDSDYHWQLCTHDGCKIHTDVNPLNKAAHTYGNGVIKPNGESGYCTTYTCSVCGYSYDTEYTDSIVTDGADPEKDLSTSLIYNKLPTANEIYDDGTISSLLGGTTGRLTDGQYNNFDMVSGNLGVYFDKSGNKRNQTVSEVYTDILYEISGSNEMADISSVWIKHSGGALSTYSYEIYVSASRVGISNKKNLVATIVNQNASEQQRINFSSVKGRWLLVRITMGVQLNAIEQYSYDSTYSRIQEIAVFGDNKSIAQSVKENTAPGTELTESLLYQDSNITPSLNPIKADIIDNGKEYSIKTGGVRFLHDGIDTTHIDIVYNNQYGCFQNSTGHSRNRNTDADVYFDIIYEIPSSYYDYVLDDIYIKLANGSDICNAYKYEIFISDSLNNIDNTANMVAAITNTSASSSQLIKLKENVKGSFLLWRVTAGVQENFNIGTNLSYARLSEISLYGHKDASNYDINTDNYFDIRDLVREKKIIAGCASVNRAADFDGDGTISASDLVEIKHWLLETQISGVRSDAYTPISRDTSYINPIASIGNAATGSERSINVDLSNTVFENYMGLGTNVFAATLSNEGKYYTGFNEVFFELEKKRINTLAPTTARFLFPIDWMITDTEANPRRSDWKNNKDYINYINGVFDFENDKMYSVVKYLEALQEAGTEVELNFGWKVSSRITTWFSAPVVSDKAIMAAAPRNIEAYASACAALLNYLINEKGFNNIRYLSFYNEPDGYYEFTVDSNKIPYYATVIKQTSGKLASYGLKDKIEIWGAETGGYFDSVITKWVNGLNSIAQSQISGYSIHSYYGPTYNPVIDYSYFFNIYSGIYGSLKKSGIQNKRVMITEYLPSTAAEGQEQWNYSDASQLIATANTGIRGIMNWDMFGGYATAPINGGYFHSSNCWDIATSRSRSSQIKSFFNEASVYCNYIGSNADVLKVDWNGEDIRTAAFRREDGEYTFVVEANDGSERNLNLMFSEELGKTVYKYVYIPDEANPDANALIPSYTQAFANTGNIITDTIGEKYAVYVYTTSQPRTQLKLESVWNTCKVGSSVSLNAEIVDGASDDIGYVITKCTGLSGGTVSAEGVYTAAETAEKGDYVSVKVYLKNNPSVYTIAIIEIS